MLAHHSSDLKKTNKKTQFILIPKALPWHLALHKGKCNLPSVSRDPLPTLPTCAFPRLPAFHSS